VYWVIGTVSSLAIPLSFAAVGATVVTIGIDIYNNWELFQGVNMTLSLLVDFCK
jgi:hypothetical protein